MSANLLRDLPSPPSEHGDGSVLRGRWAAVAERTIYFGHQSVGSGIVAGVERLSEELKLPLRVVETQEPASVADRAFVHFLAGHNRDYASKNAALLRLLESKKRAERPIVLLKYCYVDIHSAADSPPMFNAYRDTVETIRFEHPDVTIVHSTIPLAAVDSGFKARAGRFLGRQLQCEAAVARHRFNELIRAEFAGSGPMFDLARVEARRPDGTVAGFRNRGKMIETMAAENTYDGGHLNSRGERATAEALLDVLATVIERSP